MPIPSPNATAQIRELISNLAGNTIFKVVFTKRTTREERTMVCRLGVSKGVKGEEGKGQAYNPIDKGLLRVWDMQRRGWRSIPLENIKNLVIKGDTYSP